MKNYVITIARGFGSGGKEIGMRLSEKLGIPCYDRQLITMASDRSGIDESVFVETDEKLRGKYISNFLRAMPVTGVLEPHEKDFVSDVNVFNIMADLIRSLAKSESCIIMGKCADDILVEYPNVLKAFIEAPEIVCVEDIMKKMHVSKERATKLVRSTDKYRSKYYNYYTDGKKWDNPFNYDIVINTGRMKRADAADMIAAYAEAKFKDSVSE